MQLTLNPTLSGGTVVNLVPAANAAGRITWATPDHTRTSPELVSVGVSGPITRSNNVGKTSVKVDFRDFMSSEGCCDIVEAFAIFDTGVRVTASADSVLVSKALAYYRAYVMSDDFEQTIVTGLISG